MVHGFERNHCHGTPASIPFKHVPIYGLAHLTLDRGFTIVQEATSASTRLGQPARNYPAALLLEGSLWRGKGGLVEKLITARYSFFNYPSQETPFAQASPQGELFTRRFLIFLSTTSFS